VLRGPNPERDGVSAWRVVDVCAHAEEAYGVRYSEYGVRYVKAGSIAYRTAEQDRTRRLKREGPLGVLVR
jgi:hypothetical protein